MKKIIAVMMLVGMMIVGTACNYDVVDMNYGFDYAYVQLPNGECVEGPVDHWTDYDDSDMIQVVINGDYYYTHSINVVLVKRG